jgi:quercetin dioxygenase-like cupin family protein
MKRSPALVPLSHDHHRALAEARRLRSAADEPETAAPAASSFLSFYGDETIPHFREEEELLFPLVVSFGEARELLTEALIQHQRLHADTMRLRQLVETGGAITDTMRELGRLLEAHVRLEERELFPLIERLLDNAELATLPAPSGQDEPASSELNVTEVSWKAGNGPPEHVNAERDVLIVVLDGSAIVSVDHSRHELGRGETAIIAKGRRRKITAGGDGVRYLSVHRRRPPLMPR